MKHEKKAAGASLPLAVLMALCLAACDNPAGGNLPFVAVSGIAGVPSAGTAGTPIVLARTVEPADATGRFIAWNVKDAGSTGAK
ncbi:MAG: hypothetical protein LBO76_08285, partial [Treponema sp.]|nr:hypothetical protein [Treponema sp.]